MTSFITYLKNVRGELQHVVWPKPRQAALHTLIIILISALVGVLIGLLDTGFTGLVSWIIKR